MERDTFMNAFAKCRNFVECHRAGRVSIRTSHGILLLCRGCIKQAKNSAQSFMRNLLWWRK